MSTFAAMDLLEERRNKHDQRNIQREARGAPSPINADDLVGIGGDRRGDKTIRPLAFTLASNPQSPAYKKGAA